MQTLPTPHPAKQYRYTSPMPSFCRMCKTQFHTMYATVICGVCQQQPKKYGVLEFLRGADGYENGGMTNHGHHHTMHEAEAQAAAVRATSKGRVQVVPLADAAAYLD